MDYVMIGWIIVMGLITSYLLFELIVVTIKRKKKESLLRESFKNVDFSKRTFLRSYFSTYLETLKKDTLLDLYLSRSVTVKESDFVKILNKHFFIGVPKFKLTFSQSGLLSNDVLDLLTPYLDKSINAYASKNKLPEVLHQYRKQINEDIKSDLTINQCENALDYLIRLWEQDFDDNIAQYLR